MSTHDMEDLFSFFTIALALLIPIGSMLCKHQVRMAALLGPNSRPLPQESPSEVSELRSLIAQQALALDSLANSQRELANEIRSSWALN